MVAFMAIFAFNVVHCFQCGIIWGANVAQSMGTGASYMVLVSFFMEFAKLGAIRWIPFQHFPASCWLMSFGGAAAIEHSYVHYPADPYWHWVALAVSTSAAIIKRAFGA